MADSVRRRVDGRLVGGTMEAASRVEGTASRAEETASRRWGTRMAHR